MSILFIVKFEKTYCMLVYSCYDMTVRADAESELFDDVTDCGTTRTTASPTPKVEVSNLSVSLHNCSRCSKAK